MTPGGTKLSTVLVDDSPDLRTLLRVALERSGRFEVAGEAGDAPEGIATVARQQPDLVLLDLGLPGMGGLDALPHLRAAAPEATIVVISGYPRAELERHVSARGAAGYVEKGLSIRALVDQILATAGVLELVTSTLAPTEGGALDAARTELDQDLRSGSAARRFVSEVLARWDCQRALDVVQLLVSELVTNAVVHAASRPDVAVMLLPHAVRVEVADHEPAGLAPRDASDTDESGRGLFLLDELSSAWGVDATEDGKTVWFEVPRFDA